MWNGRSTGSLATATLLTCSLVECVADAHVRHAQFPGNDPTPERLAITISCPVRVLSGGTAPPGRLDP